MGVITDHIRVDCCASVARSLVEARFHRTDRTDSNREQTIRSHEDVRRGSADIKFRAETSCSTCHRSPGRTTAPTCDDHDILGALAE
jgi:hypothetical protein